MKRLGSIAVFVAAVILSFLTVQASAECRSDQQLNNAGWVIHSSHQFKSLSQKIAAQFEAQGNDYIFDVESNFFSSVASKMARMQSFDRVSTPQNIMYGDIVFIRDVHSENLIELRWFDGKSKHVVFDGSQQTCVTNLMPYAVNALF